MNGAQIENFLRMVDENVDLTRQEAIVYIRENQQQTVKDLVRSGSTVVKTHVGEFSLTLDDLAAKAA